MTSRTSSFGALRPAGTRGSGLDRNSDAAVLLAADGIVGAVGLGIGRHGLRAAPTMRGHGRRDLVRDEPESHRFVWYIRMVGRVKNGLRTLIDWLIEGVAAR